MTILELVLSIIFGSLFFANGKACENKGLKIVNFALSGAFVGLIIAFLYSEPPYLERKKYHEI